MKRSKLLIVSVLAVVLMLQSCIVLHPEDTATESTTPPPLVDPIPDPNAAILNRYQSVSYTYHAKGIDENLLKTGHSQTYLLLMNKRFTLGEEYAPESLLTLTCPTHYNEKQELETRAALALELMFKEMKAAGITDIMVTSAYRDYQYQTDLYNHYVREEQKTISDEAYACLGEDYINEHYVKEGLTKLNAEDAHKVVQSYSAKPGTSEHQTGLCVDFITSTMKDQLTVSFENTPAFAWLSENAHKFGFILRYPKGKENVTGYTYEPWHYRFVGREAATNIYYANLTLEEYLDIAWG